MNILGIETSCDETGIAIFDTEHNSIVSEQLFSQASKHAKYGGVVPEIACRSCPEFCWKILCNKSCHNSMTRRLHH